MLAASLYDLLFYRACLFLLRECRALRPIFTGYLILIALHHLRAVYHDFASQYGTLMKNFVTLYFA